MAIRINPGGDPPGGELIELKDSRNSYMVASFNSTIPTGKKSIVEVTKGKTSVVRKRMEEAGDVIYSLPERDVYYLVRGKKEAYIKICLVHGSFFETVKVEHLIRRAFSQVLEERLANSDSLLIGELHNLLHNISLPQDSFSKVRHIENASVKLRFRIMTEVEKEGNILNPQYYPEIKDNTLNFVVPCHSSNTPDVIKQYVRGVISMSELSESNEIIISHPFNGDYYVLSFPL